MTGARVREVRRFVLGPVVIAVTVALLLTLPVWLLVAAAASPVLPGRWRALRLDHLCSIASVFDVLTGAQYA